MTCTPAKLKKRAQFQEVYRQGVKVGGKWLVLFGLPNQAGKLLLGITASKKVGKAVVRNRARRRIRELVRHCPTLARCQNQGLTLVVNARKGLDRAPWSELSLEMERKSRQLLRKLGLL